MTIPQVFIIESLTFDNEKDKLFEGKVISQILHMSNKKCIYYYIRTLTELEKILSKFKKSNYRYLHISCHGSNNYMHTTIDDIPFVKLSKILKPVLGKRRLFLSACSMANSKLAKSLFSESECFSMIGPKRNVEFNDAAILWSSFYHLMFKRNSRAMKHTMVIENAQKVSTTFNVPLNYFQRKKGSELGYKKATLQPNGKEVTFT